MDQAPKSIPGGTQEYTKYLVPVPADTYETMNNMPTRRYTTNDELQHRQPWPKMGSDGYRSLRSLFIGDGGHVPRFGRQVTASPIHSQASLRTIYVPMVEYLCYQVPRVYISLINVMPFFIIKITSVSVWPVLEQLSRASPPFRRPPNAKSRRAGSVERSRPLSPIWRGIVKTWKSQYLVRYSDKLRQAACLCVNVM